MYKHENDNNKDYFFEGVNPLMDHIRTTYKERWTPGGNLLVDEMKVVCCGQSSETGRMRNKPTGAGLKMWAIANARYAIEVFPHSNKFP